ncbi:MAG: NusG domain II-containing protein [Firmicutes bacterium]|nr:NusG domain II-containing protein [Bacillota bacterium]
MEHRPSFFKKADIFLAIALLILGFGSLALLKSGQKDGSFVRVTADGNVWGTYALAEDRTVEISTVYGTNVLRIEGGHVWMDRADCPNHDCVEKGSISKTGQIILCLPHKLSVTIVNEGEEAPDAISY